MENFDGILYDIKSPVNYILYIGGLEIMMGFREFAKSQYDTIKLRDPALREEKVSFFVSLCKKHCIGIVLHTNYIRKESFTKLERFLRNGREKLELRFIQVHRSEKGSLLTMGMEWSLARRRSSEIM